MSEGLKKGWRVWRFDQIATMVNDRVDDPAEANVDYYVGLEHLDPESLTIRRWGSPSDVNATKLLFRKGDIIFGRRRVYQRKLAVAHFDGICSAHALVLRAKPEVVVPEFLPFFMQSDLFMERAKQISVGSLSPTINWKTLAKEEFALPPMEEQKRISKLLNISLNNLEYTHIALIKLLDLRRALQNELLFESESGEAEKRFRLSDVAIIDPTDPPLPENAPFIPMEYVKEWHREIEQFEVRGKRNGIRAKADDVLMARITPCLENGKIAQIPQKIERCGGSTEFIVFRPEHNVDKSYLYWLISSDRIRNSAIALMSGSTGRQRVSGQVLAELSITKMSIEEQNKKGSFIDMAEASRQSYIKRYESVKTIHFDLINRIIEGSG